MATAPETPPAPCPPAHRRRRQPVGDRLWPLGRALHQEQRPGHLRTVARHGADRVHQQPMGRRDVHRQDSDQIDDHRVRRVAAPSGRYPGRYADRGLLRTHHRPPRLVDRWLRPPPLQQAAAIENPPPRFQAGRYPHRPRWRDLRRRLDEPDHRPLPGVVPAPRPRQDARSRVAHHGQGSSCSPRHPIFQTWARRSCANT